MLQWRWIWGAWRRLYQSDRIDSIEPAAGRTGRGAMAGSVAAMPWCRGVGRRRQDGPVLPARSSVFAGGTRLRTEGNGGGGHPLARMVPRRSGSTTVALTIHLPPGLVGKVVQRGGRRGVWSGSR